MRTAVTHALNHTAHLVRPLVRIRRALGDENEVRTGTGKSVSPNILLCGGRIRVPDAGHEREPTTMPAHNLQHERARVGVRSRVDVINGLANTMQRGRRADGEVRHRHVVVDGSHKPDDLKVGMLCCLLLGDYALGAQFID